MRSTDASAIEVFYERHLLPAAEALRERGVRFFPRGPEPDAESWYEAPPTGPDFRSLDASEVEAALRSGDQYSQPSSMHAHNSYSR